MQSKNFEKQWNAEVDLVLSQCMKSINEALQDYQKEMHQTLAELKSLITLEEETFH